MAHVLRKKRVKVGNHWLDLVANPKLGHEDSEDGTLAEYFHKEKTIHYSPWLSETELNEAFQHEIYEHILATYAEQGFETEQHIDLLATLQVSVLEAFDCSFVKCVPDSNIPK